MLEWSKDHVTSTLFVCWAVQAALNILYGIPKQTRTDKLSGVYEHHILHPHALLTRGFDDSFLAPHSRYADFPAALIRDYTDLEILAETEEGDAYLFASKDKRIAFVTGHPEYDAQTLAQEYHNFLDAYAAAPEIMRFRVSGYNTHRIGVALDGLPYPERYFTAQPNFLRQCKMFITQDEIDHYFLREGVESRLTIYSHFCYSLSPEERQKFIKGSFGEYSGGARAGYGHTKTYKGLDYERDYNFKKYDTVHLTIPNVVKEYERLIAQKRFPGEDAIAKIPEYERGQLARTVYNGFYNAPDDVPRPYPKGADYYDALPMIEEQLQDKGKTAEMLAALTSRLDGTDESDRFYDSVRHARERLSEYVDGTFSLFNHRHDAPQQERSFVEQVAEDAARLAAEQPPAYERFSVIETDDGYAVWDDIRDEIYVDSEGVRETFPSEWQAEDYQRKGGGGMALRGARQRCCRRAAGRACHATSNHRRRICCTESCSRRNTF